MGCNLSDRALILKCIGERGGPLWRDTRDERRRSMGGNIGSGWTSQAKSRLLISLRGHGNMVQSGPLVECTKERVPEVRPEKTAQQGEGLGGTMAIFLLRDRKWHPSPILIAFQRPEVHLIRHLGAVFDPVAKIEVGEIFA